ncbi:MAG: transglycosylase SLT domain-containing protein [Dysgonamonadaceae bacterium]|jgi:membrane-bound lytic murein transglycosylase F|nr:transglycosylase SLT domain-containing protein [Dysgonamonadaceae bacterium]
MKSKFFIVVLFLASMTIPYSCRKDKLPKPAIRDFDQLLIDKEITAITFPGSISYFIYKGEAMGYEYELLEDFASSYGLKINVKIAENETRLTEMLLAGEGDLIACKIPVTNKLKKKLLYCGRESVNEQVLVQKSISRDSILKDVTDMIGKEIWVVKGSRQYHRLVNLNQELGGGIIIREIGIDTVTVEDLIGMVYAGEIKYTISDYDIAKLNRTYYPKLDLALRISHPQRSSWAVNRSSPLLAEVLDQWFSQNKNTPRYQAIMKRYFEMSKLPGDEPAPVLSENRISLYDDLFKKHSKTIGWDWRLLASIAYQESKFDTLTVSWAGASGLMGLMPGTARAHGLDPELRVNPERSIRASVKYISELKKIFSDFTNEDEKIKFILASYNAGLGHIFDGQALARKLGKDPQTWDKNVEECLKLKRFPEYYNDTVCKFGYFRGTETINYVDHVVERWHYYQKKGKNKK